MTADGILPLTASNLSRVETLNSKGPFLERYLRDQRALVLASLSALPLHDLPHHERDHQHLHHPPPECHLPAPNVHQPEWLLPSPDTPSPPTPQQKHCLVPAQKHQPQPQQSTSAEKKERRLHAMRSRDGSTPNAKGSRSANRSASKRAPAKAREAVEDLHPKTPKVRKPVIPLMDKFKAGNIASKKRITVDTKKRHSSKGSDPTAATPGIFNKARRSTKIPDLAFDELKFFNQAERGKPLVRPGTPLRNESDGLGIMRATLPQMSWTIRGSTNIPNLKMAQMLCGNESSDDIVVAVPIDIFKSRDKKPRPDPVLNEKKNAPLKRSGSILSASNQANAAMPLDLPGGQSLTEEQSHNSAKGNYQKKTPDKDNTDVEALWNAIVQETGSKEAVVNRDRRQNRKFSLFEDVDRDIYNNGQKGEYFWKDFEQKIEYSNLHEREFDLFGPGLADQEDPHILPPVQPSYSPGHHSIHMAPLNYGNPMNLPTACENYDSLSLYDNARPQYEEAMYHDIDGAAYHHHGEQDMQFVNGFADNQGTYFDGNNVENGLQPLLDTAVDYQGAWAEDLEDFDEAQFGVNDNEEEDEGLLVSWHPSSLFGLNTNGGLSNHSNNYVLNVNTSRGSQDGLHMTVKVNKTQVSTVTSAPVNKCSNRASALTVVPWPFGCMLTRDVDGDEALATQRSSLDSRGSLCHADGNASAKFTAPSIRNMAGWMPQPVRTHQTTSSCISTLFWARMLVSFERIRKWKRMQESTNRSQPIFNLRLMID
ncbi:hypothetical protein SeMB42_g02667 [Synchytrium endobioticum]|uniref:Uncharacterized protein n=1 Tax=Synchytrium endobioticum TaxID=286115 RepID=A0A507DD80_9FUNG|nr:hypothetical protein SeMB42_g02667 [Synchytrium endobioticum]